MLKAVLFDLDGTLLPLDTESFIQAYLREVGQFVQKKFNSWSFIQNLLASTKAVLDNRNPDYTNEQVFWQDFGKKLGKDLEEVIPLMNEFYAVQFDELKREAEPAPSIAQKAVQTALDRGFKIAVVTQPLFPLEAVERRMRWAGVAEFPWDLVTCYEKMHFCKPMVAFYQEAAYFVGVNPEECLMVGNHPREDLIAAKAGMQTYWVNTDQSAIPEIEPNGRGSLAEFADWLQNL